MGKMWGQSCLAASTPLSATKRRESTPDVVSPQSPDPSRSIEPCALCREVVEEFVQGAKGQFLCRKCLRSEDDKLLAPTPEEKKGLDLLADTLDAVSETYWKPGDQPAMLLDWLFLGDLNEALDLDQLARKRISGVLNMMNW